MKHVLLGCLTFFFFTKKTVTVFAMKLAEYIFAYVNSMCHFSCREEIKIDGTVCPRTQLTKRPRLMVSTIAVVLLV